MLHPVSLVALIGVKSSPHLVSHFLRHYDALGITRFLIVLHAEAGDRRAAEVKRRLREHAVEPVMEVQEYSARLKHAHCRTVVRRHCPPQSWVVYADLDEFQLYPGGLTACLGEHERRGRWFVRGAMIDRLATGGELIEIQATPSIWEQFPICAPLTRDIIGAWHRKVCAARASVPIADGGAHCIDYGLGLPSNYWMTHHLPRWHDKRAEIHHFKWDATLPQRLHEKLAGVGGDIDRQHGPEFIGEYERLAAILQSAGRAPLAASEVRPPAT